MATAFKMRSAPRISDEYDQYRTMDMRNGRPTPIKYAPTTGGIGNTNVPIPTQIPQRVLRGSGGLDIGGARVGVPRPVLKGEDKWRAWRAAEDVRVNGIFAQNATASAPRGIGSFPAGPRRTASPLSGGLGLASPLAIAVPKRFQGIVADSAKAIPRSPAPAARPSGPMSGIYTDERLPDYQVKAAQARGLSAKYNEADPRSAERAGALEEIWDRGGVPVIGGGIGPRAPLETGETVARKLRGGLEIGPGTAAYLGSRTNAPAGVGGGGIGMDPRDLARTVQTDANGRRTNGAGIGMFTRDRVTRQPSREDRELDRAIKLEQAKNAGAVEAAGLNAQAAREDRAADREWRASEKQADRDLTREGWLREDQKAEILRVAPNVQNINGRWGMAGPDGKFQEFDDKSQELWTQAQNVSDSQFTDPQFRAATKTYLDSQKNPDENKRLVPVWNNQKKRIDYALPRDVYGDDGKGLFNGKNPPAAFQNAAGESEPLYHPLADYNNPLIFADWQQFIRPKA
jgi:hypothetical protein